MVVRHRFLSSPTRNSLRWTRLGYPSLAASQGAHQALPQVWKYHSPRSDSHRFTRHDLFLPTWPERGFSSSPRLPAGLYRAMGSNLRITRSATVGKEDQKNLLSKTRRTTPNGTTSNVLAEKPPSHWTSPVQIPGIQRYQLRAGTTAKRSASPRRPVVSGPKYGPNSSALKLAQGSVYAVHPAPHQGPKTGPKLSDYPPKEASGP